MKIMRGCACCLSIPKIGFAATFAQTLAAATMHVGLTALILLTT
jgi:hypothetical protein